MRAPSVQPRRWLARAETTSSSDWEDGDTDRGGDREAQDELTGSRSRFRQITIFEVAVFYAR